MWYKSVVSENVYSETVNPEQKRNWQNILWQLYCVYCRIVTRSRSLFLDSFPPWPSLEVLTASIRFDTDRALLCKSTSTTLNAAH